MPSSEWSAEWSLRYAQKCSKSWVKTQCKIFGHYTWLLHAKNYLSRWCFFRSFLTASKPSRRSITAAKRKELKRRKGKAKKKNPKIEKPIAKDVGHFQNFDFCACPSHNVVNSTRCEWQEREAVVLQTHFWPIWPRFSLKTTKMSKLTTQVLQKAPTRSQWVN